MNSLLLARQHKVFEMIGIAQRLQAEIDSGVLGSAYRQACTDYFLSGSPESVYGQLEYLIKAGKDGIEELHNQLQEMADTEPHRADKTTSI